MNVSSLVSKSLLQGTRKYYISELVQVFNIVDISQMESGGREEREGQKKDKRNISIVSNQKMEREEKTFVMSLYRETVSGIFGSILTDRRKRYPKFDLTWLKVFAA